MPSNTVHCRVLRASLQTLFAGVVFCAAGSAALAQSGDPLLLRGSISQETGPRVPAGAIPRPGASPIIKPVQAGVRPVAGAAGEEAAEPLQRSTFETTRPEPAASAAPRRPFGPRDRTVARRPDPGFDPLPDLDETTETARRPLIEEEVEPGREGRAGAADPLQTGTIARDRDIGGADSLRLGVFVLRPSLEVGVSASRTDATNLVGTPPVAVDESTQGTFGDVRLDATLASDWVRHALTLRAEVDYQERISGDAGPAFSAGAGVEARFDITNGTSVTGSLDYAYQDEGAGRDVFDTGTGIDPTDRPDDANGSHVLRGALLFQRSDGLLSNEIEVFADRTMSADQGAALSAASDYTELGARLRVGIAATPVLTPYLEAEYGRRLVDGEADADGFDRDAVSMALRLGAAFEFDETLSAELSAGYVHERVDDAALASLGGISLAGALDWSVREGTDITAQLATETQLATAANVAGSINYQADLGLTQLVRRDLSVNAGLGFEYADQTGAPDTSTLSATIGLEKTVNRHLSAVARAGVSRSWSAGSQAEETDRSIFFGLRATR